MFSEEKPIKYLARKLATVSLALFLLASMSGCGGDGGDSTPIPPEIQAADDLLSKPYSEHFKNIQGDYAVANRIAGTLQTVVDKTDRMSKHHLLKLVEEGSALIRNPTEEHYASLQDEWNASKSKIQFKKNK